MMLETECLLHINQREKCNTWLQTNVTTKESWTLGENHSSLHSIETPAKHNFSFSNFYFATKLSWIRSIILFHRPFCFFVFFLPFGSCLKVTSCQVQSCITRGFSFNSLIMFEWSGNKGIIKSGWKMFTIVKPSIKIQLKPLFGSTGSLFFLLSQVFFASNLTKWGKSRNKTNCRSDTFLSSCTTARCQSEPHLNKRVNGRLLLADNPAWELTEASRKGVEKEEKQVVGEQEFPLMLKNSWKTQ